MIAAAITYWHGNTITSYHGDEASAQQAVAIAHSIDAGNHGVIYPVCTVETCHVECAPGREVCIYHLPADQMTENEAEYRAYVQQFTT